MASFHLQQKVPCCSYDAERKRHLKPNGGFEVLSCGTKDWQDRAAKECRAQLRGNPSSVTTGRGR